MKTIAVVQVRDAGGLYYDISNEHSEHEHLNTFPLTDILRGAKNSELERRRLQF